MCDSDWAVVRVGGLQGQGAHHIMSHDKPVILMVLLSFFFFFVVVFLAALHGRGEFVNAAR